MKILEISLPEIYSCQFCGKVFTLKEPVQIIKSLFPVCSQRCKFNVVFHFLDRAFDNEDLEFMHKKVKKYDEKTEFKRNTALFEITKHYMKWDLSSITCLYSFLILKNNYSKKDECSHFLMFSPPLYNKGVSEKENTSTLEKTKNEKGVEKWF